MLAKSLGALGVVAVVVLAGCTGDDLVPCRGDKLCPHGWRPIAYPETQNVLAMDATNFISGNEYSFVADMGINDALRIHMTFPGYDPTVNSGWLYQPSRVGVWQVSSFDEALLTQDFTVSTPGVAEMSGFSFTGVGAGTIEYYEYGDETPAFTKSISWQF